MLAGATGPVPAEAEPFRAVRRRHAPGRDLPRAHFRARSVVHLHPLPRGRRRPGQRLGPCVDFAGYLRPPEGEVVRDLELDRCVLDAAYLADEASELRRPASRLTA